MEDNAFIPGLRAFSKHPKAPDFVLCDLSLEREALIEFLQGQEGKYVKAQVLNSKAGKPYVKLDTYKKPAEQQPAGQHLAPTAEQDLPF